MNDKMREHLDRKKDELLVTIAELETERELLSTRKLPESLDALKEAVFERDRWQLKFPLDIELIEAHRKKMLALGWEALIEDLDGGFRWIAYRRSDMSFGFDFEYRVSYPESTCVKTKIGTETIMRDVYEVTCKEGAKEKTFEYREKVDA